VRRALLLALALAAAAPAAGAERDVAYAAQPGATLDYFPPFEAKATPPLVVFVAGRFWGLPDEGGFDLADLVVRALRSEGAAVALVRHRPAPRPWREYGEDVAAALAWLLAQRERLGFDPARVFLAGHASGAQLAALVALDDAYLAGHGSPTSALAGVVPISGMYRLDAAGAMPAEFQARVAQAFPSAEARRDASPLEHVRADAPPFLVLAAGADAPGFADAALGFSEALREAGHPAAETFVVSGTDHVSILKLSAPRNAALTHLLGFARLGPHPDEMSEMFAARVHWRDPRLSAGGFWERRGQVERFEADAGFEAWLARLLASGGRGAPQIGAEHFDAIPLEAWLDAAGIAPGRWLLVTNARGEQAVLDLPALRPYQPVVVIGVDAEREPFRVIDLYHTLRRQTWTQPEPERWLLARPLGAFLYFRKPPPPERTPGVFGLFALTPDSFQRSDADPWAPLRGLPDPLRELVVERKACVACHQFHGVGGRAGHLRARDAELVGGFGLPLEEYPPEVWRRYVFEQLEVAEQIGATPVVLAPEERRLLYDAVVQARQSRARSEPKASEVGLTSEGPPPAR
jgi:acetyl esterase/lipase